MCRMTAVRCFAMVLIIPATIGLAGCGGHSSSSNSGSSSSGKCASGFVSGTVAGQSKCLQNGQQCQEQNASDYKKYGFSCTKKGGRYELEGTSSSTKPSSKNK